MERAQAYLFYNLFREGHVTPIAHRFGIAAGEDVQNTIKALEAARNLGFDYFETDAAVTEDGHVVFVHQSDREKDNQAKGIPTSDQIRSLAYKDLVETFPVGGEDIPLAEDVLKSYPDCRFFIDPKQADVVKPLGRLISKLERENSIAIGAWARKRTLDTVAQTNNPELIPTCIGPIGVAAIKFSPVHFSTWYLERTSAASVQTPLEIMTPKIVSQIHRLGGAAIVWTKRTKPETEEDIQRAIEMGVDGIMADDVGLLQKVIGNN